MSQEAAPTHTSVAEQSNILKFDTQPSADISRQQRQCNPITDMFRFFDRHSTGAAVALVSPRQATKSAQKKDEHVHAPVVSMLALQLSDAL